MPRKFPFYPQLDAMDCGPACLMMASAFYGKKVALPFLREKSHYGRAGVSAQGIENAAEAIGFRSMTVKIPFLGNKESACLLNAPLPCIAHWNQNHFVVVHKLTEKTAWVADPGSGKVKIPRADFEKSWKNGSDEGIAILLEPTPAFYEKGTISTNNRTPFSLIFDYLRPHRRLMVQLFIGMLVGSGLQMVFPFLTQSIVDSGIANRNIGFIYLILAAQLMLFLGQITVQFVQTRILLFIGTRINVAMVNDFLAKLTRLRLGFFDTKMTGDLMQRIGDQSRIESFLTQSALSVLFSAINLGVFSVILAFYNRWIFGVFMLAALLYVGWIVIFLKRRKAIDYVRFQQMGENNNTLIELIQGMPEIKLQGSERKRRRNWANVQAKIFHISLRSLSLGQWQDAGAGFINQTKNILIAALSAHAVIEGRMTLGMMLAAQYMVGQLDAPLQQFIAFIRSAQDAKISLERLGEIRDEPDEDGPAEGTDPHLPVFLDEMIENGADIHLYNVSFRYNQLENDVLKTINLTIPHGRVTAIVGTSGSGKTTLIKLLLGFYQPTVGQIRLEKTPFRQILPSEWRKHCGTVMQDGYIFSDTIANNIAESDERPDPKRLLRAVEVANIADFVEELPMGFNTMVGSRGTGISQGQRQRLLIARAVYKNPDFLFFDEATNALDANNERAIVENLQTFYRGKTVVVVAHRLSTVKHADLILVMEKGEMVETGSHAELVARRGAYFNLVKNQLELGD